MRTTGTVAGPIALVVLILTGCASTPTAPASSSALPTAAVAPMSSSAAQTSAVRAALRAALSLSSTPVTLISVTRSTLGALDPTAIGIPDQAVWGVAFSGTFAVTCAPKPVLPGQSCPSYHTDLVVIGQRSDGFIESSAPSVSPATDGEVIGAIQRCYGAAIGVPPTPEFAAGTVDIDHAVPVSIAVPTTGLPTPIQRVSVAAGMWFRVALAPGSYTLVGHWTGGNLPSPHASITVTAGSVTTVLLPYEDCR